MLKSFRSKLAKTLDPDLVIENEQLLDVNDDCIDGMKALMEENKGLNQKVGALETERDNLLEKVGSLQKRLAPKTATERKFNEIDYWD
jgi:predicted nuclease with TOPRIM domain